MNAEKGARRERERKEKNKYKITRMNISLDDLALAPFPLFPLLGGPLGVAGPGACLSSAQSTLFSIPLSQQIG